MESLGKIERLWRYPVKSLLGESCTELKIDRRGVKEDCWFAIRYSLDRKLEIEIIGFTKYFIMISFQQ